MSKPRIVELDVIRCLGIVFVISLWHGQGYVFAAAHWSTIAGRSGLSVSGTVVVIALGLIAFVSGYGMAYGYGVLAEKGDAGRFLIRRALRLYPMYVVALTVFLTISYPLLAPMHSFDWVLAQYACVGVPLSGWVGAPILTLWFVQLILLYCVVYAVVMSRKSQRARLLTLVFVLVVLSVATFFLRLCDIRVIEYVPAFVVGAMGGRVRWTPRINGPFILDSAALIAVAIAYVSLHPSHSGAASAVAPLLIAILPILAVAPAWAMSTWIVAHVTGKAIAVAAYASYGAYLCQRPVLNALASWWNPSTALLAELWFAVVGLVLAFVIAYAIQRCNDWIFAPLARKTRRHDEPASTQGHGRVPSAGAPV